MVASPLFGRLLANEIGIQLCLSLSSIAVFDVL